MPTAAANRPPAVFRAADTDAAIALANDVPFGLGSSVWTNDPDERARFERDIEAGMVAVNSDFGIRNSEFRSPISFDLGGEGEGC